MQVCKQGPALFLLKWLAWVVSLRPIYLCGMVCFTVRDLKVWHLRRIGLLQFPSPTSVLLCILLDGYCQDFSKLTGAAAPAAISRGRPGWPATSLVPTLPSRSPWPDTLTDKLSLPLSVPFLARRVPRWCLVRGRAPTPRTASSSTQVKMGCTLASAWPHQPKSRPLCGRIPGARWPWPEPAAQREGTTSALVPSSPHLGEYADRTFLWRVVSVPLFWKRCISQETPSAFTWPVSEEPERRRSSSREWPELPTARQPAPWPWLLPASLPLGQPGMRCPLCHFQKPGLGPGSCLLRNIERFLKRFLCIAPNHVLLLISFGYSRISSSLFHTKISHAFMEKTIRGHLVHTSGGWVGSWGFLSKISLTLQDYIVTVNIHCDWCFSKFILCDWSDVSWNL